MLKNGPRLNLKSVRNDFVMKAYIVPSVDSDSSSDGELNKVAPPVLFDKTI